MDKSPPVKTQVFAGGDKKERLKEKMIVYVPETRHTEYVIAGEDKVSFVRSFGKAVLEFLQCLCELLSTHEDFSLVNSCGIFKKIAPCMQALRKRLKTILVVYSTVKISMKR